MDGINDVADAVKFLEEHLDKIPIPALRERIKRELATIRETLLESRNPRVVLIGRRGAGKSSLVNALFGEQVAAIGHTRAETMEATWRTLSGHGGSLDILDTRGLQEGGDVPGRDAGADDPAVRDLAKLFEEKPPDVILFLVKAKEADAAIGGDLTRLSSLLEGLKKKGIEKVPVLGVVTQCDELEPKHVALHAPENDDPDDVREKLDNVRAVTDLVQERLNLLGGVRLEGALGVSSYMVCDRQTGAVRRDERWQIEALQEHLFEQLPRNATYEWARLAQTAHLRERIAQVIVKAFSTIAVGIAITPMPAADIIPLTATQGAMVLAIARLREREVTMESAIAFISALGANVGLAIAAREAVRALAQLVPGIGTVTSGGMAWAVTRALGEAAIAWYIRDDRDNARIREAFKSSVKLFRKEAADDVALKQAELPPPEK